jgi:hypothetical protein
MRDTLCSWLLFALAMTSSGCMNDDDGGGGGGGGSTPHAYSGTFLQTVVDPSQTQTIDGDIVFVEDAPNSGNYTGTGSAMVEITPNSADCTPFVGTVPVGDAGLVLETDFDTYTFSILLGEGAEITCNGITTPVTLLGFAAAGQPVTNYELLTGTVDESATVHDEWTFQACSSCP